MKFADLFCGIGGSSYGALEAGLDPCLMVDSDESCGMELPPRLQTFFYRADLALPDSVLWEKLQLAEVVLCSPPCQAFSALASGNGRPTGRDADRAFAKTISLMATYTKRKLILIENVPQFLKTDMAVEICSDLVRLGYHVNFGIRDASDFGVPQRRRRSIILATSKSVDVSGRFPRSTVRSAFVDLPPIDSTDPLHLSLRRHSPLVMQRIEAIPKDGGSRRALPEHLQLSCHQRSSGYNDVYGRMRWDDLGPTITSGCTNPSKGRFLHPDENRAITLREAARLQTLPDDVLLPNSTSVERRARMIGNAFPSRFVKHLLEEAL